MNNLIGRFSKNVYKSWTSLSSWQQILFAISAGIIFGLLLGKHTSYIKPLGLLFIHAIQMMVTPVVFTAIVCAVISMEDLQKMRRLGMKALAVYAVSMGVASIIGLTVATLIQPGAGLSIIESSSTTVASLPTFADVIANIIPHNPLLAFTSGNILQVVVFAIILGISINLAGEKGRLVADFFRSFSTVTMKLVHVVMKFAPLGIFALLTWVSGEYGISALLPLMKFVFTVYLSCFLLAVIYYSLIILFYTKINPLRFFQHSKEAILVGFSTTSSAATLPVTMHCAENKLGIPSSLSGFLLPLGTTMNLNGLSVYLSVAVVFAANVFGVTLTGPQYITVVLSIILTSMGAGGIPGSAIMVMSAVLTSVGLPISVIPLIAGVDRINDMANTTVNVVGDLFSALIIAKSENELGPMMSTDVVAENQPMIKHLSPVEEQPK